MRLERRGDSASFSSGDDVDLSQHPVELNVGIDVDTAEESDSSVTTETESGDDVESAETTEAAHESERTQQPLRPSLQDAKIIQGSFTGLTEESRAAVQWVHKVPGWAKPLASSLFNLLDVTFRMLSILYLAASVAEMMTGGLELIFSVVAARVIRKREIGKERWWGVGIMTVGLVVLAASDFVSSEEDESSSAESTRTIFLGILFVLLKVAFGVLKDITQELFMQESQFPPMLLLGTESFYGLLMAIPLYVFVGPLVGYDPTDAIRAIGDVHSPAVGIAYTIGLLFVVLSAGIYSILGTAVTSAMTRSMWKNFRGLVVWIIGIVVFYVAAAASSTQNSNDDDADADGSGSIAIG